MLIEILLALVIGVLVGTLTGLTPGIHINLIGAFLVSSLAFFLQFPFISPAILIVFIVSMAISHTFIDFIPSIFLGAPEEDTVLSILPGHKLLKMGHGYQAVYLTTYGCLIAVILIFILSPIFLFILPKIENIIRFIVPYLLISSLIFLIYHEKHKLSAIIVILLSGFLGIAVLNSQVNEPLLPMLSGLFGVSSLIISIKTKTEIPQQIIKKPEIKLQNIQKPLLASLIASPLCSIFPALGSGQAAIIGSSFVKLGKKGFLVLLGITNIVVLGLSFVVLYSIGKSRTGIAANISQIIPNLKINILSLILIIILITGIICFFYTLFLAKQFSRIITKVNYATLSLYILIIIAVTVFLIFGIFGIFILVVSTLAGIFGILSGARRINLMGCLLVPTILVYLL